MVISFESQMLQLLFVDLCLHPKNGNFLTQLSSIQYLVEHTQVLVAPLPHKNGVEYCHEYEPIGCELLVVSVDRLGELVDFLKC